MTQIDYQKLALALTAQSQKAASGTPSNIVAHGPGGVYSPLGLSPGIANAMLLPSLGLTALLPARTNNQMEPLRGIFTGQTADNGDEPETRCESCVETGATKLCTHTAVYGWLCRETREMRLDRFGRLTNRGEFTDLFVVGNPLDGPKVPDVPVPGGQINGRMVTQEIGKLLFELKVSILRAQARDIYNANPANNTGTALDGGRVFFNGLDILINTGRRDAITNQLCPAADSIIENFNNANIIDNPDLVVRTFASIMRRLNHIAAGTGLAPVRWVISMHPNLFYELTELWPCAFLTNRCNNALVGTQSRVVVDAERQNALRNEMRGDFYQRTGQFLWIDGQQVPVVLDDGITETEPTTPGEFSSDVYFVPLTVRGGSTGSAPLSEGGSLVTYWEYYSFNAPGNGTMAAAQVLAPNGMFETTDGGRFLFQRDLPTGLCVVLKAMTSPRIILETPHLAARFTNLAYTPIAQVRSPFTDSAYFADGGVTDFLGWGPSYNDPT